MKKHPCQLIYEAGANGIIYGQEKGICRITGIESTGINFNKWVRKTFTDIASLSPGTIISNEALFCFDEASQLIMNKVGKDKPQRFRTYTHIIHNGEWFCYTKADKEKIYNHIISGAEFVCLADSGQKHIVFKHKDGMWQLEDQYIMPDIELLKKLHSSMCELLNIGISQTEIISGEYLSGKLSKIDVKKWRELELEIKQFRGNMIFNLASWMLFNK